MDGMEAACINHFVLPGNSDAVILPPMAGRDFKVYWTPAVAGLTFSSTTTILR